MRASILSSLQMATLLLLALLAISAVRPAHAFSPIHNPAMRVPNASRSFCRLNNNLASSTSSSSSADGEEEDGSSTAEKKKKGDSIRDATGIRPSLNPTCINCVAEALLLRSQYVLGKTQNKDGERIAIDATSNADAEPIQIAITAAGIAMSAIDQRAEAAEADETTEDFTTEESQTISGRVVGVVMRMRELERLLLQRVNGVAWVRKYGEEESFGVSKKELLRRQQQQRRGDDDDAEACSSSSSSSDYDDEESEKQLAESIEIDPLFRMNRAECLLALFLSTVETPQLEKLGVDVAGSGSGVDFIDADRLEVLLRE